MAGQIQIGQNNVEYKPFGSADLHLLQSIGRQLCGCRLVLRIEVKDCKNLFSAGSFALARRDWLAVQRIQLLIIDRREQREGRGVFLLRQIPQRLAPGRVVRRVQDGGNPNRNAVCLLRDQPAAHSYGQKDHQPHLLNAVHNQGS
ncbi:hypothetical protein D3C87_1711740 [compost metagenome]